MGVLPLLLLDGVSALLLELGVTEELDGTEDEERADELLGVSLELLLGTDEELLLGTDETVTVTSTFSKTL
jgi:hypothetical protein